MPADNNEYKIYFSEPRLFMSASGRALIRIFGNSAYGLSAAGALILPLSDIASLRALGWLLVLFLANQIVHFGRADKSLNKPLRGRVNAAKYLTPSAYYLIESAFEKSSLQGSSFFLALLRQIIQRREIQRSLRRLDVKIGDLAAKIEEMLVAPHQRESKDELFKEIEFLAGAALTSALENGSPAIMPADLFSGLARLKQPVLIKLFNIFDLADVDLENTLAFGHLERRLRWPLKRRVVRHRVMNRAWTARPTPTLDRFSTDLTDLARSGRIGFLVGHEKDYEQLVDILARPGNPNAVLIGEPGSGKSALVEHLALEIVKDRVPSRLFDRRLVALSLGSLSAGGSPGEVRERIKKIIEEIHLAGNIILYIPDIHNLVKSGGLMEMSAADVFLPAIKSSDFSVIGATYPREYKQYIETASEFRGAFELIRVTEITDEEAARYLIYQSLILERQYKLSISFKAVKQAVALARRYFRNKLLPASAEDILKEALAGAAQKRKRVLAEIDVLALAEERLKMPLHKVQALEASKLLDLEKIIHERLIGQDEAVRAVSGALREYRSGLTRAGGPIASFLFVGPTGVGKTELAKVLSQIQFGDQNTMLRFDMSEYQEKQSIARLIGSADGNIRGSLTDKILERPYSLILLDEFEKAHPDLLNLFLQVFDDGRLTDGLGRLVDFQNTILIATSNAHSEFIKSELETGREMREISEQLKRKLTDYFRAELLNRFSAIIVFKPLSREEMEAITKIQLSELARVLSGHRGIELVFDERAVKSLANLGYDPVFGARPLRRLISDRIRAVLAEKILKKEIQRGGSVRIEVMDGEVRFITNY